MEKEDKGTVSLDGKLARAREMAKKSQCCTFRYKRIGAPTKREDCNYMELSKEEVEGIIPQLRNIFRKEMDVSRLNVLCVSDDTYLKFGIENGEGYADGEKWRFKIGKWLESNYSIVPPPTT